MAEAGGHVRHKRRELWAMGDVNVEINKHLPTTGGSVWPAARRLCEYLAGMSQELGLDKPGVRILELGAGLGYLGLNVARNLPRAAEVCLTEQGEGGAMEWLQHNVRQNAHLPGMQSVTCHECDWRDFAADSAALAVARQQARCHGGRSETSDPAHPPHATQGAACQSAATETSAQGGAALHTTHPINKTSQSQPQAEQGCEDPCSTSLHHLLSTHWDFIIGSDLIYNHIGSCLLPQVIRELSSPDTVTLYCHTRHRFDHLDMEFMEKVAEAGLACEEVREPWVRTPPPSPPPLTSLWPELRIAIYRLTLGSERV